MQGARRGMRYAQIIRGFEHMAAGFFELRGSSTAHAENHGREFRAARCVADSECGAGVGTHCADRGRGTRTLAANGFALLAACEPLRQAAEQGSGYLYDRPELAGKLGGECGADYVLMGQTWKPSYLFVFPQVQVVDAKPGLARERLVPVSRYIQLEASTLDRNVTEAAGEKLAQQIIAKLKGLKN